ncbi:hypothetical protein Acsp02_84840 [Actinoplanes sp. NBRC 103695]|nr:hypothetical protein Acsp02_84840 [Actinoplanes sp. NBRC 103695]
MRGSQDGKADLHLRVEQDGRAVWRGTDPELPHPAEVLESLDGRFRYLEMNEDGSRPGLRTAQLGAVHALGVLGGGG